MLRTTPKTVYHRAVSEGLEISGARSKQKKEALKMFKLEADEGTDPRVGMPDRNLQVRG